MAKIREMLGEKVISGFKGKLDFYYNMGIPCVRRWPRSPGSRRSLPVQAGWTPFSQAVAAWTTLPIVAKEAYQAMSSGTGLTSRDVHMRSMMSGIPKLYDHPGYNPFSPNPEYWALTAIRRHTSETTDLICATTTVPCHLWLRKTSQKTWIHKETVRRRGLMMHYDFHVCFVSWTVVEQRELFDTSIHSFIIGPPASGKFTLFYLLGQINNAFSPSTTPVLQAKFRVTLPFPTITEEWSS